MHMSTFCVFMFYLWQGNINNISCHEIRSYIYICSYRDICACCDINFHDK